MAWRWSGRESWRPYVPAWKRREEAAKKAGALAKKGQRLEPVVIEGRKIAHTFWGESWCENLERYSDFENRLPRGRSYVRNGSVIDLGIERGKVRALVSGSEIYTVSVKFAEFGKKRWHAIKEACAGKIDSVIELLEGRFSEGVMEVITARDTGLFPSPKEIEMECSCPDWATMCKHVAAALYGVGNRLDGRPDLLFLLRGVDQAELVKRAVAGAVRLGDAAGEVMDAPELEKVFGIEIDAAKDPTPEPERPALPARVRTAPVSRRRMGAQRRLPARNGAARKGAARTAENGAARTADMGARRTAENGSVEARIPRLRRFFRKAEFLTNAEYRKLFSLEGVAASRELADLTARGVLNRSGYTRGTQYRMGAGR